MGFIPTEDNNTNQATININSSGSQFLRSLSDCSILSPINGQGLVYDGTTSRWKNKAISSSISTLTDCTITNPVSSQVLYYNGGRWINATVSSVIPIPYLSTDQDVTLSNLNDNDDLVYNASTTMWNNKNILDIGNIPSLPESKITNLVSDLAGCEKISNKNVSNGYAGLDGTSKIQIINLPQIDHTSLSNIGTNTHAQIDTFISSSGQANSLASEKKKMSRQWDHRQGCKDGQAAFYCLTVNIKDPEAASAFAPCNRFSVFRC